MLITTPLFMSNYTFTAFARNDHATSRAMIGAIAGSLFNIVFDYIFMFSMGLGLSGAALATAFSPAVTMTICSHTFSVRKIRWNFSGSALLSDTLFPAASLEFPHSWESFLLQLLPLFSIC